jgi:hypothetical protein
MGCAEDCSWVYGERVWYPKDDPCRTLGIPKRPLKGLVLTTDWGKVDEIWTTRSGYEPGKIWRMLPHDWIRSTTRNSLGCICSLEGRNGSTLTFDTERAFMNNRQSAESSDWDFIHVDEPICQEMWAAHSRGLTDRHGSAWFTLTPVRQPWIFDMFFPKGLDVRKMPSYFVQDSKWAIRGSTYDNPYISAAGIEEFEQGLSLTERECRLRGIPLDFAGLIYTEFEAERHVLKVPPEGWDNFQSPPLNWPLFYAVDPHPQTPSAILFGTVSPLNQLIFYDEVFAQFSPEELSREIHKRIAGRHVLFAICDPSAWINNPVTKRSIADEFARYGILLEKGTKALHQGIITVKGELKKKDRIYVAPNLIEFLFEITRYCWKEQENRPIDKDDHMMENWYRLVVEDPRFIDFATISREPIEPTPLSEPDLGLVEDVEGLPL